MNFFINLCNVIDGCCRDLHYTMIQVCVFLWCYSVCSTCFFLSFEQFDMLLGRLEKDGSRKVKICALLCNCCFTFCPSPALLTCICLPVFSFTFSICHSLTQSVRQTQKPSFHTPPACSVIVWMSRIKKKNLCCSLCLQSFLSHEACCSLYNESF